MALQWTPLRLMMSGNGTQTGRSESSFPQLRSPRKMTDRAVQCDGAPEALLAIVEPPEATEPPEVTEPPEFTEPPEVTEPPEATAPPASTEPSVTTIAEINTSEPNVSLSRPLSVEFTNSLGRERRRTACENVDEIVVLPINGDANTETDGKVAIVEGKCEIDGVKCKAENGCCVDCLYFYMKCCECTIV